MKNRILNVENPVNWNNPLNYGLVGWWLAGLSATGFGSNTWKDLCRRYDGTLASSPQWLSSSRTGGRGGISFNDSVSCHVSLDPNFGTVMRAASNYSISCWVNPRSGGANENNATILSNSNGGSYGPYFSLGGNKANWYTGFWVFGTISVPNNTWTHLTFVLENGTGFIYVNGAFDISNPGFTNSWQSNASTYMGGRVDALAGYDGIVDDMSIWTRTLSRGEIANNYVNSKQAYSDRLNWIKRRIVYFLPSTNIGYSTTSIRNIFSPWVGNAYEE